MAATPNLAEMKETDFRKLAGERSGVPDFTTTDLLVELGLKYEDAERALNNLEADLSTKNLCKLSEDQCFLVFKVVKMAVGAEPPESSQLPRKCGDVDAPKRRPDPNRRRY